MAGEGKKREKFHTHRAGKLDQEDLYTGAAHLYPPLNRSCPPPRTNAKTNNTFNALELKKILKEACIYLALQYLYAANALLTEECFLMNRLSKPLPQQSTSL